MESYSIWTFEWSTNYPILDVFILPEVYIAMEKDKDFFDLFWDVFIDLNDKQNPINMLIYEKYLSTCKDKIDDKYSQNYTNIHLDTLDRIKEIFSLIQSNYFLQLEQAEEKALFLDIDVNYLYDATPNIGAVAFMNDKDITMLEKRYKEQLEEHNRAVIQFINPFNYKDKDIGSLKSFMLQARKYNGYLAETNSKDLIKQVKENVLEKNEYGQITIETSKDFALSYEILYGQKNYGSKIKTFDFRKPLEEQTINIYDGNPDLIKIFSSSEELENYKRNFNEIMNKEINSNNMKAV